MTTLTTLLLALTVTGSFTPGTKDGKLLEPEDIAGKNRISTVVRSYYWGPDGELREGRQPQAPKPTFILPESPSGDIVYGTEVSRNEFNCDRGIFPCPGDKGRIAVYRKDQSRVGKIPGIYETFPYPMNGTESERLEVCVCDTLGNIQCTLKVTDFDEEKYLTQVCWSPDSKYIFIQVLDRAQHNMRLNMYDSRSGEYVRTILEEHNDAWIEPLDPLYFIKGSGNFIYRTDNRDKYRNLYLCDTLGNCKRITPLENDVQYIANDGKFLYYMAWTNSGAQTALYRTRLQGGKAGVPQLLSTTPGVHEFSMNPGCTAYIDKWSNLSTPTVIELHSADGKLIRELSRAEDLLKEYSGCEIETGTVESADGRFTNLYRLVKPLNFDPKKKYPLIVYVYGGPHSQMVNDSYLAKLRMWEMLMAQKGYAVYVQDNRGTSNKGSEYEKAINRQCGSKEMEDQMAGLRQLLENEWIDRSRIGVHGWSYGGFMTISLLTNYPDTFKAGLAGGPVIDWRWYEIMYGERYMDTEATNPEGFEKTSLMNRTRDLKAKLLICHGIMDETVIPQHSLNFTQKCIEQGIQLEYFPYPLSEHNMRNEAADHLYTKITDFFLNNL
ncbi:MAG: prolyl oligopeptidase family serine peptidase [Bacteroidales bacterium]|nr:prolyl oligopeptidase family serine peptidase [Bacteroidales bacterium]